MTDDTVKNIDLSIIRDIVEISGYSFPVWSSIVAFILISGYSPLFMIFPLAGLLGLTSSIGLSRQSTTDITLIAWPIPKERVDRVTSVIAYNSTLLLGVMIATIAWLVASSWYIGALFAMITPSWFLRHIQFFVYEL